MGIEYLRYGPPYYKTHTGPGSYDWSFSDDTFNRLRELNINPIEISVGKKYSGENFSSGKTRSWRVICKNNLDETGGLKMTKKSLPGKAFSLNIGTKF